MICCRAWSAVGTKSDDENLSIQVAMLHAIDERDELKLLLDQVHEQLEKIA